MSAGDFTPVWANLAEACKLLGMGPASVKKLGREGVLRFTFAAGQYRFKVADIEHLDERIAQHARDKDAGPRRRKGR
ncbi:helix-turn-helix domain-containing protein [Bifidobacterium stellenboschense]|uniref:Helix-turn-helix domain-containing protein n=1 Tax=Bifidobacterium stellenboschense TaxID=762211 RepID=A0A087DQP7_9BIFI|nr:helix-turn-helix domain-containing protein [Bifidobacterium stellenboschense]KFI97847.1 hypothetical protein BSTEL_0658 [Bifidobacterium stellenboschense]